MQVIKMSSGGGDINNGAESVDITLGNEVTASDSYVDVQDGGVSRVKTFKPLHRTSSISSKDTVSDDDSTSSDSDTDSSDSSSESGSDSESVSTVSTTELLGKDPLFLVLSQYFMTSDSDGGKNITDVLEDISKSVKKGVKVLKKIEKKLSSK